MPTDIKAIGERLMKALNIPSQAKLEKVLGTPKGYFSPARAQTQSVTGKEEGLHKKTSKGILRVCEENNLSLDYILLGREEQTYLREVEEQSERGADSTGKIIRIPVYAYGTEVADFDSKLKPIDIIGIPIGDYKEGMIAYMVNGDAFPELIPDGSIIGVNTKDRDIFSGALYLCWLPEEATLVVRRVYADGDGLILKADNSIYPPVILTSSQIDRKKTIQGRVMWNLSRRALYRDKMAIGS